MFCKHRATNTYVAVKILSKSQILKTKQVMHIKAEKDILKMVSHPFLVNLLAYFSDRDCLYLVLEYIVGGEFFTHLRLSGRFTEDTARFYAGEIVLAFEYLHSKKAAANPHKAVQQLVKAAEEEYNSSDNISAIYVHL